MRTSDTKDWVRHLSPLSFNILPERIRIVTQYMRHHGGLTIALLFAADVEIGGGDDSRRDPVCSGLSSYRCISWRLLGASLSLCAYISSTVISSHDYSWRNWVVRCI